MELPQHKLDPQYLNDLVMGDLNQPVVFHGLIGEWPARKWTPEGLASILGDKQVKIRIGLQEANGWESTQWEANCSYESTTLSNFCDWLQQMPPDKPLRKQDENPLVKYDPAKYWCYMDYKYMAQLFQHHPHILQAIRWNDFGFSGRDGQQSTVWIGSKGATTPGHYDTYGCNLVAQLYGRKKWHLFPPSQSDALYQTRIPYEESSVFSPVNISKPDLHKYPQFSAATPYLVTLEPGDVLFVPRHWWHFVETVDTSISVNTWIELTTDHKDRFHEAITRALVSGILPRNQQSLQWLNPTEELCDATTNLAYFKNALKNLIQHQRKTQENDAATIETTSRSDAQTTYTSKPIDGQLLTCMHSAEHQSVDVVPEPTHPPIKRQKYTPASKICASGRDLPECITVVPCLGNIYKERQVSNDSCCHDNIDITNPNDFKDTPFSNNKTVSHHDDATSGNAGDLNIQRTDSSTANADGICPDGNAPDGLLELFLQSVTHPQVVQHVADLFCEKLKENPNLLH